MAPKRKRTNTVSTSSAATGAAAAAAVDVPQPSSRDASGEDTEDPVLQELKQRQQTDATSASTKRARSSSKPDADDADDDADNARAVKAARTEKERTSEEKVAEGENGEKGTMRMPDPPRAGLVDPVGYKTNPPPEGRAVRVYADGVFDLFHLGHMRQLQQAKQAFPNTYLLVGVTGDKETHKRKGLTVMSARERADSVRHCKWVDEVVEDCPWVVSPEFLEKYQIDYVAHDDIPYGADEGDDIYAPIKKEGKFLVTQRTEGLSTTGIITKIVRDYDQYIQRQFKRGASRQELNVSWLKKNELDFKRNMTELRDSIKTNWTTTGQELGKELRQFWQTNISGSRPASPARSPAATPSRETPPTLKRHLSHLDTTGGLRGSNNERANDFAAGYNLGLISSVRGWMARNRRNLRESDPNSPGDSEPESSGERSPRSPVGNESSRRNGKTSSEVGSRR
ncbi:Cytidylyltransferase [Lasiodiplodia theobromae]|uniref:choline-phosphate cytidylyltransferase n=1 Tax=Lasiodiplodia theobromae TaxID=45133 RepID=A0A5N5DCJ0_9PEZI|nr:Cholinephosphate cytidylyltransferase [Lasiodiplodia theobromae]KAB2575150.1 putative choline-phosphate cytidylyltransferase [Lasiodiplodia theobromae]KAF4538949.1 Cholinephosphate cytidylyltransferase [Lasiodiplodia theobromae]KAF9637362.1 Cytidylyltransferase [Lasiodiplodia theobromae]